MNARTIRKRLMRRPNHRTEVFWGRRAYLTISVPLSMYPEAPPPFEQPPLPKGHIWSIHPVSCGVRPDEDENAVDPQLCRWGDSWEWYEGRLLIDKGDDGPYEDGGHLSPEIVRAYARHDRWIEKWLHGAGLSDDQLDGPIGYLRACSIWPKSTHAQVSDGRAVFQYGVKWFYAYHKLRFCRDVARFLAVARRAGIDARVWR